MTIRKGLSDNTAMGSADAPPSEPRSDKLRIVVVGGGTAGWMTAAALISLAGEAYEITLVESEEIGIVGVGEATLPHLRAFIERLGIAEAAFMTATHATYKLGIEFHDFGEIGERYVHPFGTYGRPLAGVDFHHYWLRSHKAGSSPRIGAFSLGVMAAEASKFLPPDEWRGGAPQSYGYAYQFDATRFGPFLRGIAEQRGVTRREGRVVEVVRDAISGDVTSVALADGGQLAADLFVDCSGFRSLLLGASLEEPWEDWSHWLPCDRAVAVPCEAGPGPLEPFTRAVAMPAGWRWRIPLRHRTGNGYVYASANISDDKATSTLLGCLEGRALAEPRMLRFKAGRRRRSWQRNVVAIGLSSGFLEPLESTSIYLVQMAITELLEHLPGRHICDADRDAFNGQVDAEYDRIRDFLILHYNATRRTDTPFWNHVRTMEVPSRLRQATELWRRCGHVPRHERGLFLQPSWVAVLLGQGIIPEGWDPRADIAHDVALTRSLNGLRDHVRAAVDRMPDHAAFLAAREASR